jgi:hypothetical protein
VTDLQRRVLLWGIGCFGPEQMADPRVRGLRLLEEAIEFAQSVHIPLKDVVKLAGYVYERPMGTPEQELGGVAVCALAAASAIEKTFETVMVSEIVRCETKTPEYFARRNQIKCDAGFK